jgi:CubicO group peptidase (beta-lactamase class C family)
MRYLLLLLLSLWLTPAWADPPPKSTKQALAKIVANAKSTHSDTLLVMRNGKVLAEYRNSAPPEPIELMSVTKGFVALAVGLLIRDGKIASLDAPVHDFFPEWKQGRKAKVTLRMLMNHTSGLQNAPNAGEEIYPAKDSLQLALAAELDADPGSKLAYNNKAVNLLAGVVARAAGMPIDGYLQQALFDPMGIKPGIWFRDDAGNRHGMAGLPLLASDLAKIGQLVLDQGRWQQRQLIPADYVREMLAPQALSDSFALLWFRTPAWQEVRIAGAAETRLRTAGTDAAVIEAFTRLQGQRFSSRVAVYEAVSSGLGSDGAQLLEREVIGRGLQMADVTERISVGPLLYQLNGYLGQYLVIAPAANLIAVRQIGYRDDHPESDNYPQFIEDVGELAGTFDPAYRRPTTRP